MILLPLKENAAATPAPVRGPERFRGVLDHRDTVGVRHGQQGVVVRRLAVQVDRHQGAGQPTPSGPLGKLLRHEVGIDVPRRRRAVDEDRLGAQVTDGVGGGHERERRDQYLVPRAHTEHQE